MKTNPNDSANPLDAETLGYEALSDFQGNPINIKGLTKREHFAAMAMQGLLSNSTVDMRIFVSTELVAASVRIGKELIEALNKEEQ